VSIRHPVFAGSFYPAQPERLKETIKNSFLHFRGPRRLPQKKKYKKRKIVSVLCPHAGYQYSGPCASYSYLELAEQEIPKTVIIIGPNHTGWGSPVSMYGEGAWQTPLGKINVDIDMARKLFNNSDIIDYDEIAHKNEHSIEVQLPFLQFIYEKFMIIPICLRYQDLETSIEIGEAIYKTVNNQNVMIMASSDLTHQETQESANRKDKLLLDAIELLDENKISRQVKEHKITTCGYGPIMAAVVASKKLGASNCTLLNYYTSGNIIGEYSSVVGYAALKITL
jgi:AmmeMemoRadiSam system protein B